MNHTAYIGIGSNQGDRPGNCLAALERLGRAGGIEIKKVSRWYETEAVSQGVPSGQPDFVNGAALISTDLAPGQLLSLLQGIEAELGRPSPRPKGEPRTIDLDILFYDDLIIDSSNLKIPHPELPKRLFVLVPLCDIAPAFLHPAQGRAVKDLERECRQAGPKIGISIHVEDQR